MRARYHQNIQSHKHTSINHSARARCGHKRRSCFAGRRALVAGKENKASEFRWRSKLYHLTYAGHIDRALLLAVLKRYSSCKRCVLGTPIVHEISNAEVPYDHTHFAWFWDSAPNLHGACIFGVHEESDAEVRYACTHTLVGCAPDRDKEQVCGRQACLPLHPLESAPSPHPTQSHTDTHGGRRLRHCHRRCRSHQSRLSPRWAARRSRRQPMGRALGISGQA